jgi:hypothetical protein
MLIERQVSLNEFIKFRNKIHSWNDETCMLSISSVAYIVLSVLYIFRIYWFADENTNHLGPNFVLCI